GRVNARPARSAVSRRRRPDMAGERNGDGTGKPAATGSDEGLNATGDVLTGGQRTSGRKESFLHRLYVGTGAFDIVGKRKRWFAMFAVLIIIAILGMGIRGFHFGIDFSGGTQIQFPGQGANGAISTEEAAGVYDDVIGKA